MFASSPLSLDISYWLLPMQLFVLGMKWLPTTGTLHRLHQMILVSNEIMTTVASRPLIPSATSTCWESSRTRQMLRRPLMPGTRSTCRPGLSSVVMSVVTAMMMRMICRIL